MQIVQSTGVGVKLIAYAKALECNVWQLFLFKPKPVSLGSESEEGEHLHKR